MDSVKIRFCDSNGYLIPRMLVLNQILFKP